MTPTHSSLFGSVLLPCLVLKKTMLQLKIQMRANGIAAEIVQADNAEFQSRFPNHIVHIWKEEEDDISENQWTS